MQIIKHFIKTNDTYIDVKIAVSEVLMATCNAEL